MLDCFTHTGAFALNAAKGGAAEVLGVDASELGVAQATQNAALNGIGKDRYTVMAGNVIADRSLAARLARERYHLVLANIVADVIIPLSAKAGEFLDTDGVFLCSGIIGRKTAGGPWRPGWPINNPHQKSGSCHFFDYLQH